MIERYIIIEGISDLDVKPKRDGSIELCPEFFFLTLFENDRLLSAT